LNEIKSHGYYTVLDKEYTYVNSKKVSETHKYCNKFVKDDISMKAANNGIKYIIIAINFIIRTVVIKIMTYIGCDTESSYLSFVTNVVFVC